MDLSRKTVVLNRTESQTLSVNLSGSNNQENNQMERKPMLNIKASEYQKVLNNHLNSISKTLAGAGIKDQSVIDNGLKQAESQFRADYKATGGKHEDFFSSECRLQLDKVNVEIRKLNALNPTGKTGINVEVSTICKKA